MNGQLFRHIRHCAVAVLVSLFWASSAGAQQIWFDPLLNTHNPQAYMALFQPNAPWQRAAAAVKVFEVPGSVLSTPGINAAEIFADLRRRNIGLAAGLSPLSGPKGGPGSCGYHVEGYGAPGGSLSEALHLKAAGGTPVYFDMDEPLYFGHVYVGQPGSIGCRAPIADLVRDIAEKIRQIRTVFPNARFGEVEPLTFVANEPWSSSGAYLADLSTWFDAFQAAVGDKIAFFRIDTWWTPRVAAAMPALSKLLRAKGIPMQMIYDGNGKKTDSEWIAAAVDHFKSFETGSWPLPDAAVFQFWTPNPSRLLPETDPNTATGMIDQYLNWQQTRPHR